MTPTYHNSSPPFPIQEFKQDQGEKVYNSEEQHQEASKLVPRDELSDHFLSSDQSDGNSSLHLSNYKQEHEVMKVENRSTNVLSVKWMSSKMRLMKKMMNTDHAPTSSTLDTDNTSNTSSSGTNNIIRTCSDCNTTKTPLWRSGPRGPKSLCNACGIRQRKARRAMAATAAAQVEGSDKVLASETSSSSGNKLQIKAKRCKLTVRRNRKKLCFEDLIVSLSKNTAYHQVFPPDEKEAAILLMALSCGLAHG